MSETTDLETSDVGVPDHFPTTAKDLSHVTLYFDTTPEDGEDDSFFFVKIETPDSVNDDFDTWYQQALEQILARNPDLADAEFKGAALKFGREEAFFRLDGDAFDHDSTPTGELVQGRSYKNYDGGVTYNYDDLFA